MLCIKCELYLQICYQEDYLNNFAKLGSHLNIWYDYMEPRNADVHKTILNFLQEVKTIDYIESPRSVIKVFEKVLIK